MRARYELAARFDRVCRLSRRHPRVASVQDRSVDDVDPEVLMWLTDDELAVRRRALVREYDRACRQDKPDPLLVDRIANAIRDVREVQSLRY